MTPIQGILSAMVTPFTADGTALDVERLEALVDRTIEEGADGLVACASTGEFAAMSHDERRRVAEIVLGRTDGRVPVVVNTGAMSTAEAIELSRHAEGEGAAAIMAVPPFYERLELSEIRDYYEVLAASVALPIVVYNHPEATGVNLSADFVAELGREIPSVAYVKESAGDAANLIRLLTRYGGDIGVLNGIDLLLMTALQLGAVGSIIGAPNFLAAECSEIAKSIDDDPQAALAVWRRVVPAMLGLTEGGSYSSAVKAACELSGFPVGESRAPAAPLDPDQREHLGAQLSASRLP